MPRYFIKLFSQSVMERNQVLPVAVSQQGEWIFYLCLYLDKKKMVLEQMQLLHGT